MKIRAEHILLYIGFIFVSCTANKKPDKHLKPESTLETDSLLSEITCPHCGFKTTEIMPIETCLITYVCTQCGKVLRPLNDDCCVFCSYGSKKCPSME